MNPAGQNVGVTQVGERIWLVTVMQYDLGYFDDETCRLEPIENPFGPRLHRFFSAARFAVAISSRIRTRAFSRHVAHWATRSA
jgi:hypothetical protein